MTYDPDVRDDLLSRAAKAQHRTPGGTNALILGFRRGWRDVGALVREADPQDPDRLAAEVLRRAADCAGLAADRGVTRAVGRALAWQDAARAVALYRNDDLDDEAAPAAPPARP